MPTVKLVLTEVKRLDVYQRRNLATPIIESLPSPFQEAAIEAAWDEKIKKRVADTDSGRARFNSWKQVEKEHDRILSQARGYFHSSPLPTREGRGHSVVSVNCHGRS